MECHENYPAGIILLTNLHTLAIYAIGAYVLLGYGICAVTLYTLFILWTEISLLRHGCVNCYYYGKNCGFGRGRISALFFKRGDPRKFVEKKLTWRDILPAFLTFLIPLLGGILLLAIEFDLLLLGLLIVLLILGTAGNAVTRGKYACRYCKQLGLGCPAAEMFAKK
jgi:hypothetical protein